MFSELKRLLELASENSENAEDYDESEHYEEDDISNLTPISPDVDEEDKTEENAAEIYENILDMKTAEDTTNSTDNSINSTGATNSTESTDNSTNSINSTDNSTESIESTNAKTTRSISTKSEATDNSIESTNFTIDINQANIIIVTGFIEQSVVELFKEQKIKYNDFLSMYSYHYMDTIKQLPNEYISQNSIETQAATKCIEQLKNKKGVYILRLYERSFCIKTVMEEISKQKDINVTLICYSIPYLFEVYKQRQTFTQDTHKWLEFPLQHDFVKSSTNFCLEVNAEDIVKGVQSTCKKFFESEAKLKSFAKSLEGKYKFAYPVTKIFKV